MEAWKVVEEAHTPLHCHRVRVVPPQYDVHPVYALLPVLMTSLSREGALCVPTPGAYQSGDRGVTAPASGVSTQESVQPHRVWQDHCSGPGGLPISTTTVSSLVTNLVSS